MTFLIFYSQVGQKRPRDPEEPTPTGKKRLSKGETRVRPLQKFITHLSGKTRNFRLATAAAAAHAEDCYMMWSFWNEDPEKKSKYTVSTAALGVFSTRKLLNRVLSMGHLAGVRCILIPLLLPPLPCLQLTLKSIYSAIAPLST